MEVRDSQQYIDPVLRISTMHDGLAESQRERHLPALLPWMGVPNPLQMALIETIR